MTRMLRDTLGQLRQDLQYTVRGLRHAPVYTTVAVLSLALGIGAGTAVFSVIDGVALRTLPIRDPTRVVTFREHLVNRIVDVFPYEALARFRKLSSVFSDVAGVTVVDRSNVSADGGLGVDPAPARVALVSGDYFSMLGVSAAAGRALAVSDDRVPDGEPVAVISHAYWTRRFASDSAVIGRTLRLHATTYAIVGVMPRGFVGDWIGRPVDIWVPMMMQSEIMVDRPRLVIDPTLQGYFVRVIAHLRPSVSLAHAQAVARIAQQRLLHDMYPATDPRTLRDIADRRLVLESLSRGYAPGREAIAQALGVLALVVGVVLMIACANVAALVAARMMSRQHEMALRRALGASPGRITRQVLVENGVLIALGGVLGLVFAEWAASRLATTVTTGQMRATVEGSFWLSFDPRLDARALTVTACLCVVALLIVGLWPALGAARASLSMICAQRGASLSTREGARFGRALTVAQVALSLLVLVDTSVLVRSVRRLRGTDLGYDRGHVLLVWAQPGLTGRQGSALADYWHDVVQRASSIPGVVGAGASNGGVLDGYEWSGRATAPMRVAGKADKPAGIPGFRQFVTPGFFSASGVRILAGRDFSERDDSPIIRAVIINEQMAKYYFGNDDPVGRIVSFPGDDYKPTRVIGVVANAVSGTPREREQLGLTYFLYRHPEATPARIGAMVLVLRTSGNASALAVPVGRALHDAAPDLSVLRIDTVEQQLDDVLSTDRLLATLGTFFAAAGTLLACLGLYGLIGWTTSRRTTEIGVRKALGATMQQVLALLLGEGVTLILMGLVVGVPLVIAASRLLAARLVGVSSTDPVSIAASVLLLIVVTSAAILVPAWRGASMDPAIALRQD